MGDQVAFLSIDGLKNQLLQPYVEPCQEPFRMHRTVPGLYS